MAVYMADYMAAYMAAYTRRIYSHLSRCNMAAFLAVSRCGILAEWAGGAGRAGGAGGAIGGA